MLMHDPVAAPTPETGGAGQRRRGRDEVGEGEGRTGRTSVAQALLARRSAWERTSAIGSALLTVGGAGQESGTGGLVGPVGRSSVGPR